MAFKTLNPTWGAVFPFKETSKFKSDFSEYLKL